MGGEWIEYRLLAAGGHANPWGMEAGDRLIRDGELVPFDCGLIGPFGYSADVSRTFFCEPGTPSDAQKRLYQLAYENIQRNLELVKAGASFREVSERGWMPPPEFVAHRYPVMMHGIGMGDEWPCIPWPVDWERDGYDGVLEENMVICVESFIGSGARRRRRQARRAGAGDPGRLPVDVDLPLRGSPPRVTRSASLADSRCGLVISTPAPGSLEALSSKI